MYMSLFFLLYNQIAVIKFFWVQTNCSPHYHLLFELMHNCRGPVHMVETWQIINKWFQSGTKVTEAQRGGYFPVELFPSNISRTSVKNKDHLTVPRLFWNWYWCDSNLEVSAWFAIFSICVLSSLVLLADLVTLFLPGVSAAGDLPLFIGLSISLLCDLVTLCSPATYIFKTTENCTFRRSAVWNG